MSIASVADLYIAVGQDVKAIIRYKAIEELLTAHRLLRWEDELTRLLDAGAVTQEPVKEAFPRSHGIATFLAEHAVDRSDQSA
ncbi:hypothetical protein [Paraburkholderia silvatlantica]|uniref:Uncharacterized protein n=1 Tax=Paraburkholderia silvatlantica TaxID=321895 RepID=A0ABR6FX89_9BURK|nr:hypothetical protein [Paraburkholderia silvatlantica]MBB2932043.1 hypothetical protein [Paraburkholderia silvatlantica]PVY24717.1 hypothetical protein C7411_127106 [Paraburkholderia silvatlantica]PXW31213.1 hypothetical protein C7413_126106 [Paraburkholderia silvatlantica]